MFIYNSYSQYNETPTALYRPMLSIITFFLQGQFPVETTSVYITATLNLHIIFSRISRRRDRRKPRRRGMERRERKSRERRKGVHDSERVRAGRGGQRRRPSDSSASRDRTWLDFPAKCFLHCYCSNYYRSVFFVVLQEVLHVI